MCQAPVVAKQIHQYINKIPAYGDHSPNMHVHDWLRKWQETTSHMVGKCILERRERFSVF